MKTAEPCYVCGEPTISVRSLTIPNAAPVSQRDAVAICRNCREPWNKTLILIRHIESQTPKP